MAIGSWLRCCCGPIEGALQRGRKMGILLRAMELFVNESSCGRISYAQRTKKSNWLPVRTTLQPRHFRLGAFLPPSTKSSFRLRRPTLVIFRLETKGRSFFLGASTKVLLLMVGRSGEPKREGLGDSSSALLALVGNAGSPGLLAVPCDLDDARDRFVICSTGACAKSA